MSGSPFLTPEESRLRRQQSDRRRRRNRIVGLSLFAAALLAGVIAAVSLNSGSSTHTAARNPAKSPGAALAATAPARSPAGLLLSKPALPLSGISTPASDPIQLEFRHPPRAGILFDLTTGRVLWQRNAYRHVEIASLTKMMTALLTVRSAPPSGHVLVTKAAVDSSGSKVGVLPLGKHVRVESMLYGLLLPSGNDAAVALAEHVAGSIKAFVERMNAEAAKLGMGCTRYSSPSGYFDKGNYSCAADLAILAHVDMAQPRIARVVHTYSAVLPFPIKGGKLYLYNNNPLLIYKYPGVTGLKTGFTLAAGRCLVATAERGGVRLGVVILNSSAPGVQAKQLLDRGFEHVYHLKPVIEPPLPAGA
jgi:serine-type D-Ala-D-Ala carboxypeptidase (penicillin-binding protein 5/6)